MRVLALAAGAVAVLSLLNRAAIGGAILTGPIISPIDGYSYYLLGPDTWTGDEAAAESIGGHLATITSLADDAWVYGEFTPLAQNNLWIGLYDPAQDTVGGSVHANNFVWASGSSSSYRNWGGAEPDNNGGNEWYTLLQYQQYGSVQPLEWNDVQDVQGTTYGVAEVVPVPEPASCAIFAIVSLALLRRQRFAL